jgi:hypothetical protein
LTNYDINFEGKMEGYLEIFGRKNGRIFRDGEGNYFFGSGNTAQDPHLLFD